MPNNDQHHDPVKNLYAQRPRDSVYMQHRGRGGRRISIRMILGVVLLAFVVIVWVAYPRGAERFEDVRLPLVRAEQAPYKVKPSERGGEVVPYQDSTVFDPLEQVEDIVIENILPDPEEPMSRDDMPKSPTVRDANNGNTASSDSSLVKPPSLNLDVNLTDKKAKIINVQDELDKVRSEADIEVKKETVERINMPAEPLEETVNKTDEETTDKSPVVKAAPVAVATPKPKVVEPKPVAKAAPKPTPAPTTTSGGTHYIQMGAFQNKEAAEKAYRQASLKYGNIIAGAGPNYAYADLGTKGVFYRLKLGPVSEGKAQSICQKILAITSGGCFVTK